MRRLTNRLNTYRKIGDDIQVYPKCEVSRELIVILITIWWLQKLGENWQEINKQLRGLMGKDLISGS